MFNHVEFLCSFSNRNLARLLLITYPLFQIFPFWTIFFFIPINYSHFAFSTCTRKSTFGRIKLDGPAAPLLLGIPDNNFPLRIVRTSGNQDNIPRLQFRISEDGSKSCSSFLSFSSSNRFHSLFGITIKNSTKPKDGFSPLFRMWRLPPPFSPSKEKSILLLYKFTGIGWSCLERKYYRVWSAGLVSKGYFIQRWIDFPG